MKNNIMMKVLISALLIIISSNAMASMTDSQRKLAKELTLSVKQINATLPKLLDEETRLDSAATTSNVIIYTNTLVNYSVSQLNVATLDPLLLDSVIKPLCNNEGLKVFIDLGVVMVYRYLDKYGVFVTELSKNMSECTAQ